jgi:hypothetical protein
MNAATRQEERMTIGRIHLCALALAATALLASAAAASGSGPSQATTVTPFARGALEHGGFLVRLYASDPSYGVSPLRTGAQTPLGYSYDRYR